MDSYLADRIKEVTPKINPDVANGLAVRRMAYVEQYLDNIIQGVSGSFREGLKYHGITRCTPLEEFAFTTSKRNNKRMFDVARTDMYMVKIQFSYKGEYLRPKFLQLPFVGEAGTIVIGGARFVISPVLADRVISKGTKDVFVRLLRDRFIFERLDQNVYVNGNKETIKVVHSTIYHNKGKRARSSFDVNAKCTPVHYLLGKYGFYQVFTKFGKCDPHVGKNEITPQTHPPAEWTIFESLRVKPRGHTKQAYTPSKLRLAIRNSEITPMVKSLVAGFFYIVDHFPTRVEPEYVDAPTLWKTLMGHLLFGNDASAGKLLADVSEHYKSLDEYIDDSVGKELKAIGYPVENVYELFAIVVEKFNDWIIEASMDIGSMYGKQASILYYVMMDITSAIFVFHFRLKAASRKELTIRDVENTLNQLVRTGLAFSIARQTTGVSNISYSGDNKYFKITATLLDQNSAGNKQGSEPKLDDPSKHLDVSIAEAGAYLSLPKNSPDGRAHISPHVMLDASDAIVRNPKFIELLNKTDEVIRREQ